MESRVRNLDDITLEEKVDFLKREESYPHPTGAVESIETHMSWVFLAGQYAYKLKKPVIYEFIDFSTPEKRLLDCREEVRLNRRLAAEVYLGVVPLTLDPEGSLSLVGEGKPVDWLVKMKRLPRWEMLDEAIRNRSWHPHDLNAVTELLIDFYAKAIPADITPFEYENRLESDLDSTFRELRGPRSRLSRPALDATEQSLITFL